MTVGGGCASAVKEQFVDVVNASLDKVLHVCALLPERKVDFPLLRSGREAH